MIELPPVEVKENDVCVKMLAAPINPSDINRIEGSSIFSSLNYYFRGVFINLLRLIYQLALI